MNLYLGNLSVKDIERRLQITLTDDERKTLTDMREQNASNIPADKWHCFDIPFTLACGSMETAIIIRDILQPHSSQMKVQLELSLANT